MRQIKIRGLVIEPLVSGEKWITSDEEYHEVYLNYAERSAYINGHEVVWESVSEYTGLKDKEGKEIYEGDVIKVPSINDHVHGNYSYKEIIYRNGTWIAQYIKSEKGQVVPRGYMAGHLIDCYDHDYKALVFYDDRLEHTDIEVVGNIYESLTK